MSLTALDEVGHIHRIGEGEVVRDQFVLCFCFVPWIAAGCGASVSGEVGSKIVEEEPGSTACSIEDGVPGLGGGLVGVWSGSGGEVAAIGEQLELSSIEVLNEGTSDRVVGVFVEARFGGLSLDLLDASVTVGAGASATVPVAISATALSLSPLQADYLTSIRATVYEMGPSREGNAVQGLPRRFAAPSPSGGVAVLDIATAQSQYPTGATSPAVAAMIAQSIAASPEDGVFMGAGAGVPVAPGNEAADD